METEFGVRRAATLVVLLSVAVAGQGSLKQVKPNEFPHAGKNRGYRHRVLGRR